MESLLGALAFFLFIFAHVAALAALHDAGDDRHAASRDSDESPVQQNLARSQR